MADTATISQGGSEPQVNIIIGFAQFGKYRFALSDQNGQNFKIVAQGNNADSKPDTFVIPVEPEDLDGRILRCQVIIAAFESGPGEFYSMIINITQDGNPIPESPYKEKGELDGVKVIQRDVRFRLA